MIGSIAIAIALAASVMAVILYFLVARGRSEFLTAARYTTHIAIIAVLSGAGTLLYYIFTHRFDINYVYEHTSLSLSKPLLFSTFYASQEGSFMLWAVWSAIIAIFLMGYSARQRYEPHVMAVFMSVIAFLALMLVAKSPFETIYAAHPGQLTPDQLPTDGKGLNPSLQNLWIVIHPPMLFLGFSLLAVPFAFAIAGLLKRDYQGWVVTAMPWTLGAGMVLGFGVMLGGFWAYETLGWGGYWAWDPVENASLLPWLITVAGTHTMLTQKRTGGLIKTNVAMTLLAFGLVLYASFLTRSGVLTDASVHSFADPGALAYGMLLGAMIAFIGFSLITFIVRWKEMSLRGQDYKLLSRETSLSIASAVLGASALVVFIGTSAPLVKHKVDPQFYNGLHIPIAIVLMAVNGLSLLLKWRQTSLEEMWRKSIWALAITAVLTVIVVLLGVTDPQFVAIVAASFFALLINVSVARRVLAGKWAVQFDRSQPTKQDYFKRLLLALKLALGLSVLALFISTAGDYNLFLPLISTYFPYFFILLSLLILVFVTAGYPRFSYDTKFLGAYIAHIGVALFMLGVVATARYSQKETVQLVKNQPTKVFGGKYKLTYAGYTIEEPQRYHWIINIEGKDGLKATAQPLWFFTPFNGGKEPISNPSILKYATKDLYFTTAGVDQTGGVPTDTLGKGQIDTVLNGALLLKFNDFDFPQEEKANMMSGKAFRVKASVEATALNVKDAKAQPLTLSVTRNLQTGEAKEEDAVVPGTSFHVQLGELKPDMQNPKNSKVILRFFDDKTPPSTAKEFITVEAFIKPWINLVWVGILVLVAGFGFSVLRRRREARSALLKAERAYERSLSLHAKQESERGPVPGVAPLRVGKKKEKVKV